MDQSDQDEMRKVIREKMEETNEEIDQLKKLTKPVNPDNAYGRLSKMDAINNKTINDAALRKQKSQLQKLERALKKIDEGQYGTCLKYGDDIPLKCLKFMPWTAKCVKCA